MQMQQFEQQVHQQLVTRGYNQEQSATIMDMARRMASGQNVTVNQSWLDVNDLNRVASAMANARANPRQRAELLSGLTLHGPERAPALRAVPRRTPERTYAYSVTLGTRTYEVVSRTELPARSGSGPAGLERSRLGQIRSALLERTSGLQVYSVSASGERHELNAAERQRFAATYVSRYNQMQRELLVGRQPDELISVASVRRRPSGG
jgi:hypothetical protein